MIRPLSLNICARFASAALLVLLCSVAALNSEVKFDGRAFLLTGQRALSGQWDVLYTGVPGSGPYTYMPQVSPIFAPLAAIGIEQGYKILIYSNAACLWLSIHLASLWQLQSWAPTVIAGAAASSAFWFIAYEGLYIGQIDLCLMCGTTLIIAARLRGWQIAEGVLLGILLSFKPQFALLALPMCVSKQYRALAAVCVTAVVASVPYLSMIAFDLATVRSHLTSFVANSSFIAANAVGPVNQSAASILRAMLGSEPYGGRFDPVWYAPRELSYRIITLDPTFTAALLWGIRIVAVGLLGWIAWKDRRRGSALPIVAALASLPSLSPVFWQVHTIYLFPVVYFLLLHLESLNKASRLALVIVMVTFALVNPVVLTPALADRLQSYGAYYWCSLALFVIIFGLAKGACSTGPEAKPSLRG